VNSDSWGSAPWIVQEHIPVLESRFILCLPRRLKVPDRRDAALPQEKAQPTKSAGLGIGGGPGPSSGASATSAIPDEPNQPPLSDTLPDASVIPVGYAYTDWPPHSKKLSEYESIDWEPLARARQLGCPAARQQVTEGETTPIEKAEAIRLHSRSRQVEYTSRWPCGTSRTRSSQKLRQLGRRHGNAVAMLRAIGLKRTVAAIRAGTPDRPTADVPLYTLYKRPARARRGRRQEAGYFSPGELHGRRRASLELPGDRGDGARRHGEGSRTIPGLPSRRTTRRRE